MDQNDSCPSLALDPALMEGRVRAALVWGLGLPACPASLDASPWIADLLARVRATGESFILPARKTAVRDMLRHGKYKPAGRAKPSSEYLLAAALEGEPPYGAFPLVNGPVDANNAVSLAWGYPASIFDMAKCGPNLFLRWGSENESYIFNPSGQKIDLEDLLVACRRMPDGGWEACGNPVKDAMATKVFAECRDVVAIVYSPASEPRDELAACAKGFCALLLDDCGASVAAWSITG